MVIKPESNNGKILLALQNAKRSIPVKELAEISEVPYKNIHRNIKQLLANKLIYTESQQIGRNRYKYVYLTKKGKSVNIEITEFMESYVSNKPFKISKRPEVFEDEFQVADIQFGIRFYAWFAQNLHIPNYSRLPLTQLKLKIGLKLIKQTNLIDIKAIVNKYLNGDK